MYRYRVHVVALRSVGTAVLCSTTRGETRGNSRRPRNRNAASKARRLPLLRTGNLWQGPFQVEMAFPQPVWPTSTSLEHNNVVVSNSQSINQSHVNQTRGHPRGSQVVVGRVGLEERAGEGRERLPLRERVAQEHGLGLACGPRARATKQSGAGDSFNIV